MKTWTPRCERTSRSRPTSLASFPAHAISFTTPRGRELWESKARDNINRFVKSVEDMPK
jgi:hypothetical protein